MNEKAISHAVGHVAYITLYTLLIVFTIIYYRPDVITSVMGAGWGLISVGIIILAGAIQSRKKALSESGKETLIKTGLYGVIRHPEFFGHISVIIGLILISQHLINTLIGIGLISLLWVEMSEEEERNIRKFGEEYKKYMQQVPRINILASRRNRREAD